MGLLDLILSALKAVWDFIEKIVVRIVNFFRNILSWFQTPKRFEIIRKNIDILPVVIKQKLESGDFQVVNCLYDQVKDEIEDAQVITAEKLDEETLEKFKDKNMIILR